MLDTQQNRMIPDLIGLKTTKRPSGDHGFYMCPFHSETNPSLSINFEKGIWHCFSCHEGGTLNTLCKKVTNLNIYQVLGIDNEFKRLGNDRTFKKANYVEYVSEAIDESKISLDIRGIVVPYINSKETKQYLQVRGISEEIAQRYDFKYADDVYINGQKFVKRLLIPIYGETGRLVNIEGRDITRQHFIKVLYPKDSIKPIWNIQNLKKDQTLYLTEGLMDLFLLEQDKEFFSNVSVVFGSAISPYQKKMLQDFPRIVTIFNNDKAGVDAHERLKTELDRRIDKLQFSSEYNDIGEIWENGKLTVKEFREKGGFVEKRDGAFFL